MLTKEYMSSKTIVQVFRYIGRSLGYHLTVPCIMLQNGQAYFKNHFKRFLKYAWPFYNIMHERVNIYMLVIMHIYPK